MKSWLLILVSLVSLGPPVVAAPIVTLGPPVVDSFLTVDPGSIRVEMLGAGDFVDLQLSLTVHPFCFRPIEVGLDTTGDGGTFTEQTGAVLNECGGDTSVFNIRLTGDGLVHAFDIEFLDLETGVPLVAIPVVLYSGPAPVVTLGPPVADSFATFDPGSIRVEMLGAGSLIDLQVSMTVHPFCFVPIDVGLGVFDDGGVFINLTGPLVNQCGGDTSVFDIRLTGDGLVHAFDIGFFDLNSGVPLFLLPVEVFPGVADTDADGITDFSDNCTLVANPDQRDTNADDIGNLCDPDLDNDCDVDFFDVNAIKAVFLTGDPDADLDGDGSVGFLDLGIMKEFFLSLPGPSATGCN